MQQPMQQQAQPQPMQPQPSTATAQGGVTVASADPNAQPQPAPTSAPAQPGQPAPQAYPAQQPPPYPGQQPQPYPGQQPQPYPGQQPQPYPGYPGQQPQPYPGQQPHPYPGQYPQPYPAQYPQHPQQYPPPPPAYPAPMSVSSSSSRGRLHDGEVIADFAIVGTFAAINVIARQDIENGNAVTFLLLGGVAGGGGIGYLLSQKYKIDSGAAHATTLGMSLGFANGALLIQPTGWTRGESVVNLLFLGSAAGAAGGFIYGQAAKLTSGQSLFVANLTLLGISTAALGAITASRDGDFGNFENGTLALGLDGGAVAGALIAPSLDWSPRRAKVVMASTVIGALAGGMLAGLVMDPDNGESRRDDGDIVTAAMTAGLWGGFGLGIMMTKQSAPDPKFMQPVAVSASRGKASANATPATSTVFAPWIGHQGQLGMMAGGAF
jgi:hypothetical protein